jgi:hypothetical protein
MAISPSSTKKKPLSRTLNKAKEKTMSDKIESTTFEYKLDDLLDGAGAGTHVMITWDGKWSRKYGPKSNPRTRCYDGFGQTEEDRNGTTTHIEVNERDLEVAIVRARREYENAYARLRNLKRLIAHIPLVKDRRRRGLHEPALDGFVKSPKKVVTVEELYSTISAYGVPDEASLEDIIQTLANDGYIDMNDEDDYDKALCAAEEYLAECSDVEYNGGW